MMLTKNSPRSEQLQKNCSIRLMPHQLATVHKMLDLEQNRERSYDGRTFVINYGILGNDVGSGKSYVVLDLCCADIKLQGICSATPINSAVPHLGSAKRIDALTFFPANVIVVPHAIFHQWRAYVVNYNPEIIIVANVRDIALLEASLERVFSHTLGDLFSETPVQRKFDLRDNVSSGDLRSCTLLVKNTVYSQVYDLFVKHSLYVKRLFFDEYVVIRDVSKYILADFTWLISSSYRSRRSNSVSPIIRDFCAGLPLSVYNSIVITVAHTFVNMSFNVPPVITHDHQYRVSSYYNIFSGISSSVKRAMDADSLKHLCASLNISVESTQFLLETVLKKWNDELVSVKGDDVYSDSLRLRLRQRIEGLRERAKAYECVICYYTRESHVITACCFHVCCTDCILSWIREDKSSCPMCRKSLEATFELYRGVEFVPVGQINAVISVLQQIVFNKNKPRVVICAYYDESHSPLIDFCVANAINYAVLAGNEYVIRNIIGKFSRGEISVILLTYSYSGVGTNLEMATDLILVDTEDKQKYNQLVGRSQRPGRVESLNVHRIVKKL